MTVSSYTKMLGQLKSNPGKLKKYIKHNKPKERAFGKETRRCERCGNSRGFIGKYGLNLCRRCFKEVAIKIGFRKYR